MEKNILLEEMFNAFIEKDGNEYYQHFKGDIKLFAFEYAEKRLALLDVSESLPLIEALNDYIKLLGEELDETAGIAAAHGWQSKRIEQGERLRAKLKDLGNAR